MTRNTRIYSVPFREVSENHAFMEGEGDKSLDYWRKVHMEVLCEEFELLKL